MLKQHASTACKTYKASRDEGLPFGLGSGFRSYGAAPQGVLQEGVQLGAVVLRVAARGLHHEVDRRLRSLGAVFQPDLISAWPL